MIRQSTVASIAAVLGYLLVRPLSQMSLGDRLYGVLILRDEME